MSKNDKDLIELICSNCHNKFNLSYGRYRRLPKDHQFLCINCTNIKRQNIFKNLSSKERELLRKQRSEAAKKVWNKLSKTEYQSRCLSQKERWKKLSKEEKELIMQNTRKASIEYLNLPETKAKMSKWSKERWQNLSDEERNKEIDRLNQIRKDFWNSLSDYDKLQKMLKLWKSSKMIGPSEYQLKEIFNKINLIENRDYIWGYETYPYVNPLFYEKFPRINPITKQINYPFHVWDFLIYDKYSDLNILIDVDGSSHSPKMLLYKIGNNSYTEREKADYNDSKRPYQIPDKCKAFIIKAYTDKIDDYTEVIGLNVNYQGYFKDFINIIQKINTGSTTIDQLG